jgi:maltooligosyltrehalose trehalohydrolase
VAEFDGDFGWGYDGVCWFAPSHLYGSPDDFRAFVDEAHVLGLGVILDVVYNHLGPSGNYLPKYSSHYTSTQYENEWGAPLNFDGPAAKPVRELVLSNVEYWITEFHIDGFRLDATQQIFDRSPEPLIGQIAERARAVTDRGVIITGENEPQDADLLRPKPSGGYGLDAVYNDDFHHAARVALTGVREAYYTDYEGSSRELLAATRWGFLFQGQYYSWQQKTRGDSALDARPTHFVAFLENHDQVANSAHGRRLLDLTHPGDLRALTALLLLAPGTPMLFQGQERGSTAPFMYFAGHTGELGEQVRRGRVGFLGQFPRLAEPDIVDRLSDPSSRRTFESCRLSDDMDARGERLWRLHKDLIALRHGDSAFSTQARPDGACLSERVLLLRSGEGMATRLVLANLGSDFRVSGVAEPLIAPPRGARWCVRWSSEHPDYGGAGTPSWNDERWTVPAHAAVVLAAEPKAHS